MLSSGSGGCRTGWQDVGSGSRGREWQDVESGTYLASFFTPPTAAVFTGGDFSRAVLFLAAGDIGAFLEPLSSVRRPGLRVAAAASASGGARMLSRGAS